MIVVAVGVVLGIFPEVIVGAEIPRDVKDIKRPVSDDVVVGPFHGHVGDSDFQNSTGLYRGLGFSQDTEVIRFGGDILSDTGPNDISVFQEILTQVGSNESGRPRDGGNWSLVVL